MNNSQLNNSNLNLSELSVEKIQEFINLLEDHQITCVKSGKFVEAELAKQRVIQLKQIEKDKNLRDLKIRSEEIRCQIEIEQKEELENFNKNWDERLFVLNEEFNRQEVSMKDSQQQEIDDFLKNFEPNYPQVKASSELLNLNKILDQLIKKKDYMEAHNIQVKLNQLSESEQIKHHDEKEKRNKRELDRIRVKHETELETLQIKMNSSYGEFKRNRALEFDKTLLKYQNKCREIERASKMDEKNLAKITKGVIKINHTRLNSTNTSRLNITTSK